MFYEFPPLKVRCDRDHKIYAEPENTAPSGTSFDKDPHLPFMPVSSFSDPGDRGEGSPDSFLVFEGGITESHAEPRAAFVFYVITVTKFPSAPSVPDQRMESARHAGTLIPRYHSVLVDRLFFIFCQRKIQFGPGRSLNAFEFDPVLRFGDRKQKIRKTGVFIG
mgnify:CR=1 FL=1